MDYSIIAIGDELLIGQVTDTNSGQIERLLTCHGWQAQFVKIIGDTASAITGAIDEAFAKTDVVLMTGGLGPTRDDITKATLCKYFGGTMQLDEQVLAQVSAVFKKRDLKMNDLTRSQAIVPSSCRVLPNEVGTAPIMWFEKGSKVLVSMPGVPFEMLHAMTEYVIPALIERFPSANSIGHRTIITLGITESDLATRLSDFEDTLPDFVHLAYLPNQGIVRLRLTGEHHDKQLLNDTLDRLELTLDNILGKTIACHGDLPLAQIVGNALMERGLTLATAESCTGGNIAHQITSIAGSSNYFKGSVVSYSNDVKVRLLGVPEKDLLNDGAVSQSVVTAMAEGAARVIETDCAVATSGIAGPGGGTSEKPVGTVWIAATCREKTISRCYHLPGDRQRVINRATTNALTLLLNLLNE